jgi:hypothetical protein
MDALIIVYLGVVAIAVFLRGTLLTLGKQKK